jgi:serine protein kinase
MNGGIPLNATLPFHLKEVLAGNRKFENAAQAVYRMILEGGVEKITRAGETVYDYKFFRQGKRHIVGWYDEINEFVSFVGEAAIGGSPAEMGFVLVGEPGNGKTFFVDYVCSQYRRFLSRQENRRYTIEFINLDKLGKYGRITVVQSQTFEDPLILAMNLFEGKEANEEYLRKLGFDDATLEQIYSNYRPLGACTEHIWSDIREYCDGDIDEMLSFVRVVPVPIAESLGTVTGKYSARDKITSSATDLLGEEDLSRLLNLSDPTNPYKYNVRHGALARVAGGGIHFADEIFRNKPDLVQVYLQVVQNRNIELDGYRWPIDVLIIGTSNNDVYNEFVNERREAPIKDRFRVCYISHNTDYRLQQELTKYVLAAENRVTVTGDRMHEDPNFNYVLSVAVVLTRLPHSEKLTPVETMKLEAGETAGEKSVKTLIEIKTLLKGSQDVRKRWGQKGIGHRGLGRIVQRVLAKPETQEGKCLLASDLFEAIEQEINDYVPDAIDREKYIKDMKVAESLYVDHIKTSIYNAYRDDPEAIRKDVGNFINMIIAIGSDQLGPDKIWRYRDRTGELKTIKIDERYVEQVEARLGLKNSEARESFRNSIRKIHGQKLMTDPNYDFMDNESLVKAVTEVRLESDVAGAASLVGALTNRTNEENVRLYNRMIDTMMRKLNYCETCARESIEIYCTKQN